MAVAELRDTAGRRHPNHRAEECRGHGALAKAREGASQAVMIDALRYPPKER
jgi:hypothetical protein